MVGCKNPSWVQFPARFALHSTRFYSCHFVLVLLLSLLLYALVILLCCSLCCCMLLAEILTRYWHNTKDSWQNIFVCQCCAFTNHSRQVPDLSANDTALRASHPLSADPMLLSFCSVALSAALCSCHFALLLSLLLYAIGILLCCSLCCSMLLSFCSVALSAALCS